MEIILLWIFLSALVAVFANNRGRSPIVFLAGSLLLSPLLMLIILLLSPNLIAEQEKEKQRQQQEQLRREESERQLESIKAIASKNNAPAQSSISVAEELKKLAELRDLKVLTDEEFQTQKNKLLRK